MRPVLGRDLKHIRETIFYMSREQFARLLKRSPGTIKHYEYHLFLLPRQFASDVETLTLARLAHRDRLPDNAGLLSNMG